MATCVTRPRGGGGGTYVEDGRVARVARERVHEPRREDEVRAREALEAEREAHAVLGGRGHGHAARVGVVPEDLLVHERQHAAPGAPGRHGGRGVDARAPELGGVGGVQEGEGEGEGEEKEGGRHGGGVCGGGG